MYHCSVRSIPVDTRCQAHNVTSKIDRTLTSGTTQITHVFRTKAEMFAPCSTDRSWNFAHTTRTCSVSPYRAVCEDFFFFSPMNLGFLKAQISKIIIILSNKRSNTPFVAVGTRSLEHSGLQSGQLIGMCPACTKSYILATTDKSVELVRTSVSAQVTGRS